MLLKNLKAASPLHLLEGTGKHFIESVYGPLCVGVSSHRDRTLECRYVVVNATMVFFRCRSILVCQRMTSVCRLTKTALCWQPYAMHARSISWSLLCEMYSPRNGSTMHEQ